MDLETTAYRVILKDRGVRGEPVQFRTFPRSDMVRFLESVKIEPRGCWEWQGHIEKHGYGTCRHGKKTVWAHRLSHQLFKGPIDEGLQIDHLCRNRACVNPDHLEAVTAEMNMRRAKYWTTCETFHPGVSPRWQQRTDGRTYCRECNRVREAERRAAAAFKPAGVSATKKESA